MKNTVHVGAVEIFKAIANQPQFKGWPLVGEPELGPKIPFFGQALHYQLKTGNGVENYVSLLRHFGWAVVFGVTEDVPGTFGPHVVTLCQWKPGVNQASWELPPGGIGKISPDAPFEEIKRRTEESYLKETGYGDGEFSYLGRILIETGKYRGSDQNDHGLSAHLFLARNLKLIQAAREPNPNEIMETVMVPITEFREVLESGLFLEESAVVCAYRALIEFGALTWRL